VHDPVGRDAQRRQAQLFVDEGVCPAHREVAARAGLICADAEVTCVMGGHETDECGRPAERAVNPGLVGPLNCLEYDLVVGRAGDILDNGPRTGCSICCPVPAAMTSSCWTVLQAGRSRT
jgi:hypothetical protein